MHSHEVSLRKRCWSVVSGSAKLRKKYPKNRYVSLTRRASDVSSGEIDDRTRDQIEKDVPRTFPRFFGAAGERSFAETVSLESQLRRCLLALCLHHRELHGYHQALSFVVGFALFELRSEEDAFWLASSLITFRHFEGLVRTRDAFLPQLIDRFEAYFARCYPEMATSSLFCWHFEPMLWISEWFTCLFTYSLNVQTLKVVWDEYLVQNDDDFIFLASLAILRPFAVSRDLWSDEERTEEFILNFKARVKEYATPEAFLDNLEWVRSLELATPGANALVQIAMSVESNDSYLRNHYFDATSLFAGVRANDAHGAVRRCVTRPKYEYPRVVLEHALLLSVCIGADDAFGALYPAVSSDSHALDPTYLRLLADARVVSTDLGHLNIRSRLVLDDDANYSTREPHCFRCQKPFERKDKRALRTTRKCERCAREFCTTCCDAFVSTESGDIRMCHQCHHFNGSCGCGGEDDRCLHLPKDFAKPFTACGCADCATREALSRRALRRRSSTHSDAAKEKKAVEILRRHEKRVAVVVRESERSALLSERSSMSGRSFPSSSPSPSWSYSSPTKRRESPFGQSTPIQSPPTLVKTARTTPIRASEVRSTTPVTPYTTSRTTPIKAIASSFAASPSSSPQVQTPKQTSEVIAEIRALYEACSPHKTSKVDKMLEAYKGNERVLLNQLSRMYVT